MEKDESDDGLVAATDDSGSGVALFVIRSSGKWAVLVRLLQIMPRSDPQLVPSEAALELIYRPFGRTWAWKTYHLPAWLV